VIAATTSSRGVVRRSKPADLLAVVADHHDGEPSAAEATDELEDLATCARTLAK
jgi:hypothetical protein